MSNMRTMRIFGQLAAFSMAFSASAQWLETGNSISGTDWFGADGSSTIPLSFETRVNQPMFWLTDNTHRMRLNERLTGQTVNGNSGLDLSGFLGVGDFTFTASIYRYPAAHVHVDNGATTEDGHRPMIGEGFLATADERLYYGGLLDGANAGVLWARSTGSPGSFRFIYTGEDGGSVEQAEEPEGLELGRFEPDASLEEGYFGIGDWTSGSATPDERLDILDRTVKIRRLVPDYNDNSLNNVVVADANGKLHWRDANTLGGCDWEISGVRGKCEGVKKLKGA